MQQEFFGFNTIKELEDIVKKYSAMNVFLITGKKSFNLSGAEEKIKSILKDVNYIQFNSFSSNPNMEEVKLGISLYKKANPDLVVGVGGGSVLDIAKAINILAAQKEDPEIYVTGQKNLEKSSLPFIAIPATAGTGSEATRFATIYIDKTKYSLSDEKRMLPTVSIVDPSLTVSMPRYLTASTGLDALCQGIESLWAINSTDESRTYAKQAAKIAFRTIKKAVNNPDKQSRSDMAKAANLSGKAINISKTTACHSISYPITSHFGIAHGHAVALTMPQLIEFNYYVNDNDCNDKRGVDFVKKQLNEVIELIGCKTASDAKTKFNELMNDIGIESSLNKLDIDRTGVKLIIDNGFTPSRMNNNPRKITKKDLKNILEKAV